MSAHNQLGKTPYVCSCGIRCHLEPHEVNSWLYRHAEHYPGVEHKLTELPQAPDSATKDAMTFAVLSKMYEKLVVVDSQPQKPDVKK